MPVRPVTYSERVQAMGGQPTGWLSLMGAAWGFQTHLRLNGLSFAAKNMLPTPFAKVTFPILVAGGTIVGFTTGAYFFGDAHLRALAGQHARDRTARTDAARYDSAFN
jgi:hypothetical protein